MIIIFLEKDGCLTCETKDTNKWSILASIARYKYFYGKIIAIGRHEELFKGFSLRDYDRHKEDIKIYPVEIYINIKAKLEDSLIPKKEKDKEKKLDRLSGGSALELFKKAYENEHKIKYILSDERKYERKFRGLIDNFSLSELKDKHVRRYIKRAVRFGNHNGDAIYIDWLFHDSVLQNYLLIAKGIKDITAVWKYLDVGLSSLEKKKIKYIMKLKNFDELEDIKKDICLKFYKKYDKKIYNELLTKHKKRNNFLAKEELFKLLSEEYDIPQHDLLRKTKHDQKYFWYEYTKGQIKEALL